VSDTFPVRILPHRIHPTLKDCTALLGPQEADELHRMGSKDFRKTQYAVTLTGPAGVLKNVPLFLPLSPEFSQVMISLSESRQLGVNAPICFDPSSCTTPGIRVTGPAASVSLPSGLHIPQRRVYLKPRKANNPHLREGDIIFTAQSLEKLRRPSNRVLIFGDVVVLYNMDYTQGFYIDAEEAAAANLTDGDQMRIIGKPIRPEHRTDSVINRKKRLITENDVRQAIMNGETIVVESWMIVTPAARELGKARHVLKDG